MSSYDSQNKQPLFLYNINQMIFVMQTRCVFYEVGTEFFNIFYMSFVLQKVKTITEPVTVNLNICYVEFCPEKPW
jgi:hypothetical protein